MIVIIAAYYQLITMSNRLSIFLLDFVKKFRREITIFYSTVIFMDLLELFAAKYILAVITNKANANNFENLALYGVLYCFLLTCRYLNRVSNRKLVYNVRKKLDKEYILKIFGKILNQDMSFFSSNLIGQLTSKIFNIQKRLQHIFSWFLNTIGNAISFIIGMIVLYFINPNLTLFGIIWLLVYLPLTTFLFKWNFKISNENSAHITKSVGIINDCFINIMNIKIFASEKREYRKIKKQGINILRSENKKILSKNILYIFDYLSVCIFCFGMFSIIFIDFMNKKATVGTVLFVFSYALHIVSWMNYAISVFFDIIADVGSINNSIDTVLAEPKIRDKKNAVKLANVDGRIVFKNVEFGYGKY